MFYYITKLSKGFYILHRKFKIVAKSRIITRIHKDCLFPLWVGPVILVVVRIFFVIDKKNSSYVLMKAEFRIILKLFLNFSDLEPQYSYKTSF